MMKEDRLLISREVYDELAASYERVETLVRLYKAGRDIDTNLIFQILGIGYLLNKEKLGGHNNGDYSKRNRA
jgi:hypothetical protein